MSDDLDFLSELDLATTKGKLDKNVLSIEELEVSITSLEAIATFLESEPEPSLEDLALVDNALTAVTANTDLTPEYLTPSLESYVGKQVSTETIRDTIVKYYNVIIDFIKRVYATVKTFFFELLDTLKPLRNKYAETLAVLKSVGSVSAKEPKVLVGPAVRKLAVGYKLPVSYNDVLAPLGVLRSVSDSVFKEHASIVSDISSEIISLNRSITTGSLDLLLKVNEVVVSRLGAIQKYFTTPVTEGAYSHRSELLFNNRAVFARFPDAKKKAELTSEGQIALAETLRAIGFKVDSTEDDSVVVNYGTTRKEQHGFHHMDAFNVNQCKLLCANALEILDGMLTYRNTYESQLARQGKASENEAKRVAAALSGKAKLVVDGSARVDDVSALKAVLGYHSSIARWSAEPFTSLTLYNVSTLKTLYGVLTSHVSNLGSN